MNDDGLNYDFVPLGDDGVHLFFVLAVVPVFGDAYVELLLNRERMLFQVVEFSDENQDNPQLWHIIDEQEDLKAAIKSFDDYCFTAGFTIIFNGLPSYMCLPE